MKNKRSRVSDLLSNLLIRNSDFVGALGMPILVQETVPARLARIVGMVASLSIFACVIWATWAKVNEVSVATGSLVPVGFEQTIQHLEGGIVRSILVREGAVIKEGQPILEIEDATTVEDTETLEQQKLDLLAQLETQEALVEERDPDFSFVPVDRLAEVANNRNAYEALNLTMQSQKREYKSQIAQARFSLQALRAQLVQAEAEVEHAAGEELRFRILVDKGVATAVQYADRKRNLTRARAEVLTLENRRNAAIERLAETEQQKVSFEAEYRSKGRQRILELKNALTTVEGSLRKKDERRQRLQVTAPIHGIIKSIEVKGKGAVVRGGQPLATIVPLDTPLIAETRVRASQVGYLKVGQSAQVKLTAYDFTRYGWLSGRIEQISPSSFQETDAGSYYLVQLSIDDLHLTKAPDAPILPGMDLTADIITGQKTVMQYLLTPLQRTFSSAFGER